MTADSIRNVSIGQPPFEEEAQSEWLTRLVTNINMTFDTFSRELNHQTEFRGYSDVQQDPVGHDIPMQITFGPGGSSTAVRMDPNGDLTILENDTYIIEVFLQLGRIANPGYTASVMHVEADGSPVFTSIAKSQDGNPNYDPIIVTLNVEFPANTVLKFFLTRDSAGDNDGSLIPFIPTNPAIPPTASARISVGRIDLG